MENLQYYILSGKPTSHKEKLIYNKAYEFWKDEWQHILGEKFVSDDFFRHELVTVIMDGLQVVAIHLFTVFDAELSCHLDHSYMKEYPKQYIDILKNYKLKKLGSVESFTIHRDYRKTKTGAHLAQVIGHLSFQFVNLLGVDALIAPCMTINGVQKLAINAGATIALEGIKYKGHDCDLMYIRPGENKIPTDPKIADYFHFLWDNRKDFIGLTKQGVRQNAQLAS